MLDNGYAEVVAVVDEEVTIPKYMKHLRRLKSLLKQPLMLRARLSLFELVKMG